MPRNIKIIAEALPKNKGPLNVIIFFTILSACSTVFALKKID